MKRVHALLYWLRQRAAARKYRHCSMRTTELFASYSAIGAELRAAIEAETAAAAHMEKLFNTTS
jgi:hypothetical protein